MENNDLNGNSSSLEREIVLKTDGLCKVYRGVSVVQNVSMTIYKGDIYGFVGLNGSGKTTFIRLITSLIRSNGGTFKLFDGTDNTSALKNVSSMVETPSIYLDKTGLDNLKVQCSLMGIKTEGESERLLRLVGLDPSSPKLAKAYSLGMKQRLGIAICLVGDPKFMILDEPTNGLDPEGIIEIRELLLKLNREQGITILISSHILSELSKLATRFGFIHKGQLIKEATLNEIVNSVGVRITLSVDNISAAAKILEGKCRFNITNSEIIIYDDAPITDIVNFMSAGGVKVFNANKYTQDLESYFINLIGGKH